MNKINKKNKKILILSIIVIITIILAIITHIYIKNMGHKVWLNGYDYFVDNNIKYIGSENIIDSNEGIQYSFSICIRTDNLGGNAHWMDNDNVLKVIFNGNGSPNIMYNRKDNTIEVQMAYKNDDNIVKLYNFICDNFESQVWVNLCITVNNRKVNIFKNGILYKSTLLPNVNIKSYKRPTIGDKTKNFNGYIGNIDYYNYILDKNKIFKIYYKNKSILPNKLKSYSEYQYDTKKESEKIKINTNIFRLY